MVMMEQHVQQPASEAPGPLVQAVAGLAESVRARASMPDARITCDDLLEMIGTGSHALALFTFSLLNLLPAPPGYNFMLGLVIIAFSFLLTLGRPIRLWPFIGHRRLPLGAIVKLLDILAGLANLINRISKPRLAGLVHSAAIPLIGAFGMVMGLTMLVPIPFTNMLPSIATAMIGVGILNRDGLLIGTALIAGVLGILFVAFTIWLVFAIAFAVDDVIHPD